MVRANLMALAGGLLSIASVALLWFFLFLGTFCFGSGESQLSVGIREQYERSISVLFMVGAAVVLFSQLGVLLEIPAIVLFPFIAWWRDGSVVWVLGYCVGLIGVVLTIHSSFVQVTFPGMRLRIPPESRTRVWYFWKEERSAKRIPRRAWYAIASATLAAALISTGVVASAYVEPMSRLSVSTHIDSAVYGDVDLVITLDGSVVAEKHLAPAPDGQGLMTYVLELRVTAGSHDLTVDARSTTYPDTNNRLDFSRTVRVLPFTTEEVLVGIGVGFA
jgi:hypothetical protein